MIILREWFIEEGFACTEDDERIFLARHIAHKDKFAIIQSKITVRSRGYRKATLAREFVGIGARESAKEMIDKIRDRLWDKNVDTRDCLGIETLESLKEPYSDVEGYGAF